MTMYDASVSAAMRHPIFAAAVDEVESPHSMPTMSDRQSGQVSDTPTAADSRSTAAGLAVVARYSKVRLRKMFMLGVQGRPRSGVTQTFLTRAARALCARNSERGPYRRSTGSHGRLSSADIWIT